MKATIFLLCLVLTGSVNAGAIFVDYGESRKVFGEFDPEVTLTSISIESDGGIYFGLRLADIEDTEYAAAYIGAQSQLFFISGGVAQLNDEVPLLDGKTTVEAQGGIQFKRDWLGVRAGLRHLSNPEEIDDGRDFIFIAAGIQF